MSSPTRIRRPCVLIVEDLAEISEVFQRVFKFASFDVLHAADGAEGVRLAEAHRPDVIVMDVMMPVLDGLSALRLLKSRPITAGIPVVVMSGEAHKERQAFEAGAAAFLAKPFGSADLLAAARAVLRQSVSSAASTP